MTGCDTVKYPEFHDIAINAGFRGAAPVGDAFQFAVNQGLAQGSSFYGADGTFVEGTTGQLNLWWLDPTQASTYGSDLSALTLMPAGPGLVALRTGRRQGASPPR